MRGGLGHLLVTMWKFFVASLASVRWPSLMVSNKNRVFASVAWIRLRIVSIRDHVIWRIVSIWDHAIWRILSTWAHALAWVRRRIVSTRDYAIWRIVSIWNHDIWRTVSMRDQALAWVRWPIVSFLDHGIAWVRWLTVSILDPTVSILDQIVSIRNEIVSILDHADASVHWLKSIGTVLNNDVAEEVTENLGTELEPIILTAISGRTRDEFIELACIPN